MSYQLIYSGPLLFKTKISNTDIKKIGSLCERDVKLDTRKDLAGLIDEEFLIKDTKTLSKIITPYLELFKQGYEHWYAASFPKKVELLKGWVNYMKPGECNPPHIHLNCNFSSVLYLSLPKNLKKESESSISNFSKPGQICFNFSSTIKGNICFYNYLPEVGDFFIFPNTLTHSVNSFKSKGERVSVSINFNIE